jgi:hypothetical protein
MEIKKFEAYNYKGKDLDSINREEFLTELYSMFEGEKICGYDINGTSWYSEKEILFLHVDKKVGEKYESKVIQLDFSDLGIEFGSLEWNDDTEDFEDFESEKNLDTEMSKQMKSYKKDIKSYNI